MPRGVDSTDEARLQGRLWTPAVLRPHAWYDAQDVSTISTATGVSEWRDKSGNGRHVTQATGTAQPAYNQGRINARPAVTFDGGDALLNTSFGLTGSSLTVFAVAVFTTNVGAGRLISPATGASDNDYDNLGPVAPLTWDSTELYSFANNVNRGTPIALALNTPVLTAVVYASATVQMWKDGTSSATTS